MADEVETRPRLLTPKSVYTFDYPQAIEYAKVQNEVFWLPDEISVENDLNDFKGAMTEAEMHGVTTTLKLFTQYELIAGAEYWGNYVSDKFPRPDIQRMASCFSYFELNVHAVFYDKLNKVLNLDTDEFYTSYTKDKDLMKRMKFLDKVIESDNVLESVAAFSIIEGAVLYSSFSFLKHFKSNGKNLLTNVVAGIDSSVVDENIHSEAGAWLFRTLLSESNLPEAKTKKLHANILKSAETVREHEHRIVDMIFEKGSIKGITPTQMKNFVDSRVDICLANLGFDKVYKPTYNPIASWFYDSVTGYKLHDFFAGMGSEYSRAWNEKRFTWGTSK